VTIGTAVADGNVLAYSTAVSGWVDAVAAAGGGKILQVVSTNKTDTFTTTSDSFTTVTGLNASITPSSTSSKILVMAQIAHGMTNGNAFGSAKVTRGGTDVYVAGSGTGQVLAVYGGFVDVNLRGILLSNPITFLDSPSSTSSLTYQVEVRRNGNVGAVHINRTQEDGSNISNTRGASSITLMEVAG